ncbi:MAG: glycosyltransferase family 2 protein [Clostridia bacterium]|nr:glycosyltransferase family 2 protein [Clostridia bacterium]
MPKMSVIIPVYNMEPYIAECLDSVLAQSLSDIEVVCVNDGSKDGSLSLLLEYEKKDARLRVIDKENAGVGAARNDGIVAATGDFIAFMDADDWYPNDRILEMLYQAATDNGVKAAGGYYEKVYEDGKREASRPVFEGLTFPAEGKISYKEFQYDYGYTGFCFETAMLKEKEITFPLYGRFQDPPFFVKAMIAAEECYLLDEVVYCYRMLPGSGKRTIQKALDMLDGMTDNLAVSKEHHLAKLHYITAMRLHTEGSYVAIKNLFDDRKDELLAKLIRATAAVDVEWLKAEGLSIPDPFVPEVFRYAAETAGRYEALRKNKLANALTWLPRRLTK